MVSGAKRGRPPTVAGHLKWPEFMGFSRTISKVNLVKHRVAWLGSSITGVVSVRILGCAPE